MFGIIFQMDLMPKFLDRVSSCECEEPCPCCRVWTAGRTPEGYPLFHVGGGKMVYAYRWLYEREIGPIPEGHQIDHLCFNPSCVRLDHLEAVTPLENTRRARGNANKTHCPQGHPYSEENTYRHRGRRQCRTCIRLR